MKGPFLLVCVVLVGISIGDVHGVSFEHGFDKVSDMLFAWLGDNYSLELTDEQAAFYAKTYKIIVISGFNSFRDYNNTPRDEWPHAKTSRQLKKLNPGIKVLLYEATDFGPHGWGNMELQSHPEWWLRDDNGKAYTKQHGSHLVPRFFDWRIPEVRKWWIDQSFLFAKGTFDGLMIDGAGAADLHLDEVNHTMTVEHMKEVAQAKMYMMGNASERWADLGGIVVGNPIYDYGELDNPSREAKYLFPLNYHWQYLTGALDEQYGSFVTLNEDDGSFNVTQMITSINDTLYISRQLGNTVLSRGYPGPCMTPFHRINDNISQVPSWPHNAQPKTPADLKKAASELVELALAPFLIIVEPNVWFSYAWFYEMNAGWVTCPSAPDSCTAPDNWYPEFDRPLGNALGQAVRNGTVYTREFEHASVYVDLKDRTASKITWKSVETP